MGKETRRPVAIEWRCDRAMARSKHLLPCDRNCLECVACIAKDMYAQEWHLPQSETDRFSDTKLAVQNAWIMSGRPRGRK